jgi:hypothetical protein
MTALGIIKLIDFESVRLLLDKMLALDSIFFLLSSILSCSSMRLARCSARLENLAELIFVAGLGLGVLVAIVLALEVW